MAEPIRIFIGYDPREAIAYHVCQQSILEHASEPMRLAFTPICGERRDGSNDFIYARFLVPYYCGFRGDAIFIDGDMIVRSDIADLLGEPMFYEGVRVVKHDYRTKHPRKYLGYSNEDYPRKNWSSVIVWNCGFFPNRRLRPEYVASQPGSYLHRFAWLKDEQIGELDEGWNKLVLEQTLEEEDKLRHFTIGTPCFPEYAHCEGASEWWDTYGRLQAPLGHESPRRMAVLRGADAAVDRIEAA
jgi:hypothetical protein